jgi:hypothetical protein
VSTPAGPVPFIDPANQMLAQVPFRWDLGTIDLPGSAGTMAVLTLRTASTTMTVIMGTEDMDKLRNDIARVAAAIGGKPGLAMPTVGETIALGNGNRRPG